MGMALVPLLADRGDEVFITSRKKREGTDSVHYIQGDAHQMEFLMQLLKTRYDAVVDFMVYQTMEFAQRLEMFLSSTDQYVFISSARVYAESREPIREDSPRLLDVCRDGEYLAQEEYALYKAKEEDMIRNAGSQNWTIIRPYITYNVNRLQLGVLEKENWLYRALHERTIVFQQGIADRMTTLTYGRDVAKVMVHLIGNPSALGETVHITSPDSMKWDDVLSVYLNVLEEKTGRRPEVHYLSDPQKLSTVMGNVYQVKYDRMSDRIFDNRKAAALINEEIGYTRPEDGLRACLEGLLDHMEMGRIDWASQGYMDRITGEMAAMEEISGSRERMRYLLYRFAPGIALAMRRIRRR